MTAPRGLHALARLHGLQTAYHDHAGRRIAASPDGLMAALRALGIPVHEGADVGPALDRRRTELWERVVEPVVVAWLPDPAAFTLRLPERLWYARVHVTAALEDGGERTLDVPVEELDPTDQGELGGRPFAAFEVPLPRVPAGYHRLHVTVDGSGPAIRHEALLLAAPKRCAGWEVLPGSPDWGVFAPLHALWTREAPDGIPSFDLLARLSDAVADVGGSVVGTLPLLASFLEQPYEPSPYVPVSKLFWNELYAADPEDGPGDGVDPSGRTLDLQAAMAARRKGLEWAARAYFGTRETPAAGADGIGPDDADVPGLDLRDLLREEMRVPELAAFVARNPRAPDYARFRALTDELGPWPGWPERLRARDVRPGDYDPERARGHLYAQWQAARGLAAVEERAAARGVSLYLDLPLGVHPEGYDTWRERDQFAFGATVGAPPDPLAPAGQDWGFHPPHPEAGRQGGHRYFTATIRNHLRFARVLRIDHVMQLSRLFWVPDGDARHGVYVRYPHEELYAILSLESHRRGAVIVGEDLGTVPTSVRREMRRRGVPGMHVVQFSLREGADQALTPGPVGAGEVASIGTHDTPMFAAWWTGRDAAVRAERGLLDPGEADGQVAGRADLRERLARGLGVEADGLAVQEALYQRLGGSRAGLVLASLEDLWLETEPQNVPGTPADGNWQRRTSRPVEAIREGEPARLLASLNEARETRP